MGIFSDAEKRREENKKQVMEKIEREEKEFLNKNREKFMEKFGMKNDDFSEEELKILDSIFLDFTQFNMAKGFLEKPDLLVMTPGNVENANASWTIVRQNWMILKQLKRIEKQLEELNKK